MVVYKGKNKEHCDEVIKNIVDNWDELVNSKQEKNKNEKSARKGAKMSIIHPDKDGLMPIICWISLIL